MKGYIYTMFAGADPGLGWKMTDPIFGRVPTLGACVPNIRRLVVPGDHIFVISGRVPKAQQYVVGGFQVAEKINALAAFPRFPENRLRENEDGSVSGNIIVDGHGKRHALDTHPNFRRRIENYIVGRNPLILSRPREIERAREQTVDALAEVFGVTRATTVRQVVGRWRRLDENQVERVVRWMRSLKAGQN